MIKAQNLQPHRGIPIKNQKGSDTKREKGARFFEFPQMKCEELPDMWYQNIDVGMLYKKKGARQK